MRKLISTVFLFAALASTFVSIRNGPGQPPLRPVPPPGVPVSEVDRKELESGLKRLGDSIEKLRGSLGSRIALLADVQIFHEAVRVALHYNEFFKPEEIYRAKDLLRQGQSRADALVLGQAPWTNETGLVVRGYVSKIDRSVQPYGLVIPPAYSGTASKPWRLDTWFHGRNETLSEVNFLNERQRNPGEFTPENAIVLHLYGRYCNANKLAGETDLFEALDAVKRAYRIDDNRVVLRGFSMGGAAVWHFAAHFAGEWAAAAPGAGFSESPEFLDVYKDTQNKPFWWEEKLWHMYNATDYATNLFHCPTVAYSGEIDRQKQAADVMEKALAVEGMRLTHVIGSQTPHRYHPDSKIEISRRIDALAENGRDPYPRRIRFTTWTLSYPKMKWAELDGLEKHWERARLNAEVVDDHTIQVTATNVSAFTLDMGPGGCPLDVMTKPAVVVDGQKLLASPPASDRSWEAHFEKKAGRWAAVDRADASLRKRPGLQGPIDVAFMDSFVMVKPTGQSMIPETGAWVNSEMNRAIAAWRSQFRGDAQVRLDTEITDELIRDNNLVLWGDPGSNRFLARIADKLPIRWTSAGITVGKETFPAATHALIAIYPNPLNPSRYVVLNSGPTQREFDYLNNARQVPKLPDYSVVDLATPPGPRWPGRIALAGFFGERWQLLETHGK
jgi:pimeloyl-ACP methyl ester carboxylesterase